LPRQDWRERRYQHCRNETQNNYLQETCCGAYGNQVDTSDRKTQSEGCGPNVLPGPSSSDA
jgi:hypothetical protein